ncbi:MAG: carboxypeptidase-like regulatory domain-containing protein [Acidobacteriaceae bacterium]|nr:carboxypeptidase-like regulatory domain-containing protein [Acidobacteriaceae bacterium]
MRWNRNLAAGAAVLGCAMVASAQQDVTSASVTGRVLDPTGAAIAGAEITALATATNQQQTILADEQGRFRFAYLPVGDYSIRASSRGFAPSTRLLTLNVGAATDLTLTLLLPSAETHLTVSVQEAPLEVNRSQISETVLESEIRNLPFAGRNYLDAALLLPGVSPTNTNSTQTLAETSEVPGQGYSINSQRNFSNNFVVDGLSNNDDAAGIAGNVFSMDTVREFQVVTAGGQAEFGRAMGGYFNIITRSGTNDLHGTAYGFLRNQRITQRTLFRRRRCR